MANRLNGGLISVEGEDAMSSPRSRIGTMMGLVSFAFQLNFERTAMSLEDLRKQYTMSGLDESEMADDPVEQFSRWMKVALESAPDDWVEPYAMTLATSSSSGDVSARIVLLRGADPEGFVFYTSYSSRKGEDLKDNAKAALVFYWGYLERQVRVSGEIERVSAEQSERYFHSRPRESQISAAISRQSNEVANRFELEQKVAQFTKSIGDEPVPMPGDWGGYRLKPDRIEFWQGRENRLHDRLVYESKQNGWLLKRLGP